jgi:hypothetical protein
MDKLELKKEIVSKAIMAHQSVIDEVRMRIKEMYSSKAVINEGQFDYQQRSQDEAINQRIDDVAEQLNFALE